MFKLVVLITLTFQNVIHKMSRGVKIINYKIVILKFRMFRYN